MNDRSSHRNSNQNAFETIVSFEPDDEVGDVHSARTAVAALPDSFLADLRRGKGDDPTTARYQVLPESDLVAGDPPTLPTPPQRTRVQELNDTITAALNPQSLPPEPTPEAPMAVAAPPLVAIALPPRRKSDERWMNAVLGAIFVAALLAAITTVALALLEAR